MVVKIRILVAWGRGKVGEDLLEGSMRKCSGLIVIFSVLIGVEVTQVSTFVQTQQMVS